MKIKKLLFVVSTVLLLTGISNAQTNLDFESWGPSTYGSNDPIDWGTLTADNIPGGPVSTIQETANPGNGSSSAKMVTSSGYASIGLSTDIFGGLVSMVQQIMNLLDHCKMFLNTISKSVYLIYYLIHML